MNADDFEQKLKQQPLRPIPAEWRAEILNSAAAAARATAGSSPIQHRVPQIAWWRELLWPCPQAWAGLAAVWAVILVLNIATHEPVQVVKASKAAPPREILIALREQRRLLAELIETPAAAEQPKPLEPRPRSEISPSIVTFLSA